MRLASAGYMQYSSPMTETEKIKQIQTIVGAKADGIWGPMTRFAVSVRLECEDSHIAIQTTVGTTPDGKIGAKTLSAILDRLGVQPTTAVKAKNNWPTQAEIRSGKSIFGKRGNPPTKKIVPPYTLYYDGKPLSAISVHEKIADSVLEVLNKVLKHYGSEKIHQLKLDRYDGCFNDRSTRSGSLPSMHAWAIAIDWDAADNGNSVKAPKALFSRPEYAYWIQCWKDAGFTGGFDWDRDWMHVQATAKV